MARRTEDGISYFPMNADIVHNPKIKLVVAEFGPKAWAVLLPLYCKIYREKGYWLDWYNEDLKLLFAKEECQLDVPFVNEVVAGCVRRGLFNKAVFDMFGVLTSDRILENYLEAKKRNKKVVLIEEFLVKNDDVNILLNNVCIIGLSDDIITKKVDIGTQNKRRRRIEGEGDSGKAPDYPPGVMEKFKAFEDWIAANAPNVAKMKEPFTVEQYLKARDKFKGDTLTNLLIKMHNWKPLLQKNVSAYLTLLNWSKNNFNDKESNESGKSVADLIEEKGRKILESVK